MTATVDGEAIRRGHVVSLERTSLGVQIVTKTLHTTRDKGNTKLY